jgi:hypothetical protein
LPRQEPQLGFLSLARHGHPGETVPDNDFALIKAKTRQSPKDTSAIRSWLERNLKPMDASNHMFTPEYLRFLDDVGLFNWNGPSLSSNSGGNGGSVSMLIAGFRITPSKQATADGAPRS